MTANKTQQKVQGLKFMLKMSTVHANTMHSNDYAIAQSLPWWWCGSAASTRSADVLSTSHHGFANGRPSVEVTPDAIVHWIQIWWIGWPHLWRDKIWHLSLYSMVTVSRAWWTAWLQ